MRGSQIQLQARVKEILGETFKIPSEGMTQVVAKVDELLDIDPADERHFFYKKMKRHFYVMREDEPEDLDDEMIERFMVVADEMSNVPHSINLKRRQREAKTFKFHL